jgi:ABC-type multidrug transport system ATPase subunit
VLRVEHLQAGTLLPLTFEVGAGECLAVEGPSGAGKTLLLRAIADLDSAPGQVFLNGAERHEMPAPQWRRYVRYCAAEPAWWTDTPREAFADAPAGRLDRLLHSLGLDPQMLDRTTSALSTGERQRLALARALVDEPPLLLLDEPTATLDPQSAALVEELVKYQTLSGRSVLLVSHDRGQIERLAHARLLLSKPEGAAGKALVAAP